MNEYALIRDFFGTGQHALQAEPPLMNRIDEGLWLLSELGASVVTRRAWCLHPIICSDRAFRDSGSNGLLDRIRARSCPIGSDR